MCTVLTECVCVCVGGVNSYSLYCSRNFCIYVCNVFSDHHLRSHDSSTQVIMNEKYMNTREKLVLGGQCNDMHST